MKKLWLFIKKNNKIVNIPLLFCIIFAQYVELQWSMFPSTTKIIRQGLAAGLNFAAILALDLLLFIIFRRWSITTITVGAFCAVWGIVNHYVYIFHGSPLFISTILEAKTAMNVIGSYQISIDSFVLRVLLATIMEFALIWLYVVINKPISRANTKKVIFSAATLIVDIVIVLAGVNGQLPGIKKTVIGATWNASVRDHGFLACFVMDAGNVINPIQKPEGYSVDKLIELSKNEEETRENNDDTILPDIILILNETYFDLRECIEIETDLDYMEPLKSIEDIHIGKAVVPNIGGGTNNTEYELLTSNSMYLLASEAPFNYLTFDTNNSSIVNYLKSLNYTTLGLHYGKATNYSRDRVYPSLGFDSILLGSEAFSYHGSYGNRDCLDSDNYKDIIERCKNGEDSPRFTYLLTLQNHGGYEQNDATLDLVHCLSDYGEYNERLDEYLTSVYLSSKALADFIDYYREQERPTIICMIGDHAPSFISRVCQINGNIDSAIQQRSVPFILWSNYQTDMPGDIDLVSACDIAPILVEIAGLPMSAYYRYIRSMNKIVPVKTSYGTYITRDGKEISYESNGEYHEEMERYYYYEYNSINGGKEYLDYLFVPITR